MKIMLGADQAVEVVESAEQNEDGSDNNNDDKRSHLTRNKISERARERVSPPAGRTNHRKATHRSGARFAASPG
jgi:hypothetical protein